MTHGFHEESHVHSPRIATNHHAPEQRQVSPRTIKHAPPKLNMSLLTKREFHFALRGYKYVAHDGGVDMPPLTKLEIREFKHLAHERSLLRSTTSHDILSFCGPWMVA